MALIGGMMNKKKRKRPIGIYRPPEQFDSSLTKRSDNIDYGQDSFTPSLTLKKRKRRQDGMRTNYGMS